MIFARGFTSKVGKTEHLDQKKVLKAKPQTIDTGIAILVFGDGGLKG